MRFRLSLMILVGTVALGIAVVVWLRPNSLMREPIEVAKATPQSDSPLVNIGKETSSIHFTDMLEDSGIDFRHESGISPERPFPAVNGSGIGALDYDLDGMVDLYFATGRPFPLEQPGPVGTHNKLYRNLGNWKFANVGAAAGVEHHGYSAGVAVGDFDGDGFPDIYLSCLGPNVLYWNRGDGTFESIGATAGVDDSRWGTSAAFLDYDADGLLDLYSCNYAQWSFETNLFCGNRSRGVRIFCNPDSVAPERHLLFHNQADGTFRESLHEAGIDSKMGRGQGVVAADVNLDGRIDLYVSNDLQPNFLFLNAGSGQFRDVTDESGAAYDKGGRSQAGMGVDAADMNGDGLPELFVTNFEQDYNTYYENVGNGQFQDITEVVGLAAASLPWVGWGTALVDLDLDGWRDVIVTNGHTDNNLAQLDRDTPYAQPTLLWRHQGRRFEFMAAGLGEYCEKRHPGRALSISDLDNDGDPDFVIGHQDLQPALLRNDRERVGPPVTSVLLRFIGRSSNRDAVGTLITMQSGARTTYHQICGGRSYLSAHDLRVTGICDGVQPAELRIHWPRGIESHVTGIAAGGYYAIIEPDQSNHPPGVFELDRRPISTTP